MTAADRRELEALVGEALASAGPPQTADDFLAVLRARRAEIVMLLRVGRAALAKGAGGITDADLRPPRRALRFFRRVLTDPDLGAFLVDLEDRLLFGETVGEARRRMDAEKN